MNLAGAGGPQRVKKSVVVQHNLKNLQKGFVEGLMDVLGRNLEGGCFYSRPSFRDGVGRVKYCWNGCRSNFSFTKNFVIVLPCNILVANDTFLKMCIFKSLTG